MHVKERTLHYCSNKKFEAGECNGTAVGTPITSLKVLQAWAGSAPAQKKKSSSPASGRAAQVRNQATRIDIPNLPRPTLAKMTMRSALCVFALLASALLVHAHLASEDEVRACAACTLATTFKLEPLDMSSSTSTSK